MSATRSAARIGRPPQPWTRATTPICAWSRWKMTSPPRNRYALKLSVWGPELVIEKKAFDPNDVHPRPPSVHPLQAKKPFWTNDVHPVQVDGDNSQEKFFGV